MQRTDAPFTPFSYCQIMNISVSDVALPHTILPCMGVRHKYCHSQAVVQERKRAWYTLHYPDAPRYLGI